MRISTGRPTAQLARSGTRDAAGMDETLAAIAASQGGVVMRSQALAAGYTEAEIRRRRRRRQWLAIRRGAYVDRVAFAAMNRDQRHVALIHAVVRSLTASRGQSHLGGRDSRAAVLGPGPVARPRDPRRSALAQNRSGRPSSCGRAAERRHRAGQRNLGDVASPHRDRHGPRHRVRGRGRGDRCAAPPRSRQGHHPGPARVDARLAGHNATPGVWRSSPMAVPRVSASRAAAWRSSDRTPATRPPAADHDVGRKDRRPSGLPLRRVLDDRVSSTAG